MEATEVGSQATVAVAQLSIGRALRLGAAALAIAGFVYFAGLVSGADRVDDWDLWTDLALLALMLFGLAVAVARARSEVQRRYWSFVVGFGALAVGQATLVLGATDWLGESMVTPADLAAITWAASMAYLLTVHLRALPRWTRLAHLVDAAMLSVALLFFLWELVMLPALGDDRGQLSAVSQVLVVLYPALDLWLLSTVVLLLLVDRSPARVGLALAFLCNLVADVAAGSTTTFPTRGVLTVAAPGWVAATVLLIAVLGLPSGARLASSRPPVLRLVIVNGAVAAALWLATWRYLVDRHPANAVTIAVGLVTGLMWTTSRIAEHLQASSWADQLNENFVELEQTHAELRALLDDLPEAVIVLGSDGTIREANRHALELTGLPREQLLGQYMTQLFRKEQRAHLVELWEQLRRGASMSTPTFRFERPDGRIVLLEGDTNLPVRDPERVVVALRDVTERVAEAGRLERARERFRLAFHNAPTGMALSTANDGTLVDVNDSLAEILGCAREELIGRTIHDITHPDDRAMHDEMLQRALAENQDSYRMEKRYVRLDGSVVWARTWVSVLDDDGDGSRFVLAHVEDVTEQRHSAERLEWAATHDGLTGLPNRFRFLERLGNFLAAAEPGSIAVLFIDLDNFKVINDSLGHDAGDQLLRAMSERLRAVVRDRDLLGRFGGDEFIVMLRDVSGAYDPFEVAERLRAEIAKPVLIDGAELFVTASIGITVNDRDAVSTGDMLRDADAAMYRAKARGRDCVELYAPGSHDATVLTLRTTNELRRGLERGEIVPYYQPVVELDSGRLIGFEVLARWRHPDRGLLGPDQFLPMAEETGLIGEVGAAVMRASLIQLGQWRNSTQRFSDLSLSVNVSVRQLMSSHLIDEVSEALGQAGVSAGALWLEITETALMSDVKAATVALRELRSLGLHLAVDDFGTGYSSLTYLKRFPVEAIKVDRSFVNGLGIDAEDSTIVEAVVKLGHSLGLQVVAEGVETPLQLSRLREIGCDRGQGYLFGRPRPAELVENEYSLA